MQAEAGLAVETREVQRRGEATGVTEDHIAGVRSPCADNQVVEAILVDISGRIDRYAGDIVNVLAIQSKASLAIECREIKRRSEAAVLAKHHVAGSECVAARI